MGETREELGIKTSRLFEQTMPDGTVRLLDATSAYDLRAHPRNYGIHCMDLTFTLKRGNVGVTWRLFSGWWLQGNRDKPRVTDGLGSIDWHSPTPLYQDQDICNEHCEVTGGPCYCDGSSLASTELFNKFLADPELLWKELESWLDEAERKVKIQLEDTRNFS